MSPTAHADGFARDHLPPPQQWPELIFDLPYLQYPQRLNAATELLDGAVARGWGERTAIRAPAGTLSYRELLSQANRIARVLVEDMGLVPGNRVLLDGCNTAMMAACWFGILKAGGIAVAVMPMLRARELAQVIDKARISHALCDAPLGAELAGARAGCPTLTRVMHFHDPAGGLEAHMAAKPADFADVDTAADDVALIAFTSGTTGKPKGTMHCHRDLLAICDCFPRSTLRAEPDDIFCGTPPLAFTFGLGGLLLFPLRIGASTVLMERLTPEGLLHTIEDYRATVCFTAPTFYRLMASQARRHRLGSLRRCVSAGEALPLATRQAWLDATGMALIDGIGTTEMLHIFISAADGDIRPGATGRAIPGYRATILDNEGREAPADTVGRLAVKGPTGCRYLDDERQREYVVDGWNLTGDAYRRDADGYFWYHGRTDDMIICAGYNIAGPEVEDVLLGHAAVAECGVVGVPDEERGQVVKAFVVLEPGHTGDEAMVRKLQEWVKRHIAPYKYPRAIVFLDHLPRTGSGKLQRYRLREWGAAGAPETPPRA